MIGDMERIRLAEQGAGVSEIIGEADEKKPAKGGPAEKREESEAKDE